MSRRALRWGRLKASSRQKPQWKGKGLIRFGLKQKSPEVIAVQAAQEGVANNLVLSEMLLRRREVHRPRTRAATTRLVARGETVKKLRVLFSGLAIGSFRQFCLKLWISSAGAGCLPLLGFNGQQWLALNSSRLMS